jgi:Vacuole effluxer Atg22 like
VRERTAPLIPREIQSSSFIGPLVVGLVADLTGNIRYSFLFLVLMLWAALPVLAGVDVESGRADARAWSSDEHGTDGEPVSHQDSNQSY